MASRSIVVLLACVLAGWAGVEMLPAPDVNVRFWCPNFDSVRVHRVNWQTRENVYVKTIPATCADSSAITFGYLGE